MKDFIARCHDSSAALPTPYRLGRVDLTALEGLCHRLIDRGTASLAPCGTTGEGSLLTPDEHRQVVETTVEAAAGRVPVIAGAGSNNTRIALDLARSAERAGATALLAVTPFYLKPSQAGIIAHFRAIHDAVGIPVILYDVPSRTGCALDDVTVKRLADLPRIVGLKDATGDIPRVSRLRRRLGDRFLLLSGDDATQAAFRAAGGDGCISVTANVAPALCSEFQLACLAGNFRLALQLQDRLMPLHDALFVESNPGPVKYAASKLGLCNGDTRLPLAPLTAASRKKVDDALAAVGLVLV